MKRLSLAVLLCLVAASCGGPSRPPLLPDGRPGLPRVIRVQSVEGAAPVVRDVALDEYVLGTILSEFAPAAGELPVVERMYEVQAVISRTYAIAHLGRHANEGFDVCSTTHCQLYDPRRVRTSRWAAAAQAATRRTTATVLRFDGRPIQALYHADCGGHTSAAAEVWGGADRPYLASHRDDGPAGDAHAAWTYRAGIDAIEQALNAEPRTRLAGHLQSIEITSRDPAGRATRVELRTAATSVAVRGEDFRLALARAFGARSLRSTWFTARRDGAAYVFTGRGFGHGVGLCQSGALARIKSGSRPADVIRFYYPGVTLEP
jgi:stage II sporulation protein D